MKLAFDNQNDHNMRVKMRVKILKLTSRITGLYHERLDHAMEDVAVVVAVLGMHAEVLDRLRALFTEQIQVNVAHTGVDHALAVELLRTAGQLGGRQQVLAAGLLVHHISLHDVRLAVFGGQLFWIALRENVKSVTLVRIREETRIADAVLQIRIVGDHHLRRDRALHQRRA